MRSSLIIGVIFLAFVWPNIVKSVMAADPMGRDAPVVQNKDAAQKPGVSNAPVNEQVGADDKAILETIQKFLVADQDISLAAEKITVTVFNGFVTLKGTVKDQHEKTAIEHKAQAVEHVRHVDDRLVIK